MSPSNSCIISQLRNIIYYNIDNNLIKNALFFAERLTAYDQRGAEAAYLIALCHFKLGDNATAHEYSKSAGSKGTHLGCAYVFAQTCLLMKRFKQGINALERCRILWIGKNNFGKHSASARQPLPDAATIHCLKGKLYYSWDNKAKAINCFEEALQLNPFMWDAFTFLCDMGVSVRVPNIFKLNPNIEASLKINSSEGNEKLTQQRDTFLPTIQNPERKRNIICNNSNVNDGYDPFHHTSLRENNNGPSEPLVNPQKLSESKPSLTNLPATSSGRVGSEVMETPSGPSASNESLSMYSRGELSSAHFREPPQAPLRKTRPITNLGMDISMDLPKISRGLTKRVQRTYDSIEELSKTQELRTSNSALPLVVERKRSVSGQSIPKQGFEDQGLAPQRRSVRLFQKQPITAKLSSSNLSIIGPPPGRELKKAKPPISRIVRPSSGSITSSRQAVGCRKPMEDIMDLDHRDSMSRNSANTTTYVNQKSAEPELSRQEDSIKALFELLQRLGSGYYALSRFQCAEALQIYSSLPKIHRDTPWIIAQLGRVYYEQAAYNEAEKFYKRLRQMVPTRFEDMEIYSTILWHLKREIDLAFLAYELIEASWDSPQAWCALGNSWSLSREHEQALKCFKRATQLNPTFAYAFTLQGHEHVSNEEYDKALVSYRSGMAADKRHYNAWYGVARVYEKLGEYEKAFTHFSVASSINPTNAVLICCIGSVLEKQKKPQQALQYFTRATELAPRSALTRFKVARTLMSIGEHDKALAELMILKDIAPEEAMVHFLLGKLYKGLKQKGLAVRHFTIALNLDPKASHQIKEAIESLEDYDEDEESLMGC
ncbi:Subunit of the Anaphase-Promoting Complex-Cyclosome [Blumeria graminis f. sp. tritici 96224]|nr:Subunit of the Anaphase-Promoting Complex-Cyclosome [Blumeria graminis f. sp. tritici 96224]